MTQRFDVYFHFLHIEWKNGKSTFPTVFACCVFLPVPDIFLPAVIFCLFCVLDKKFSKIEKHKIVSFE